jgi:hypothetical protein
MAMPWQLRRAKRRPKQQRVLFEELVSIDTRWLARHKMVPKTWSKYSYDLSFIVPAIARLTLTAHTAEILSRDGREQTIPIHWQRIAGIGYGTARAMFVCKCQRRVFRLYDVYGAFRCKKCAIGLGVRYASQQRSAAGRSFLQAQRLRRFLGEYPNCTSIHRLRGMRRHTYRRLINQLRQLEARLHGKTPKAKLSPKALCPLLMYQTELASVALA